MKYPKTRQYFYELIQKHRFKRRELASIMDVSLGTVHNFLVGFTVPKRQNLKKLAEYLNEEPEVVEALIYHPDEKSFSLKKPDFPLTRNEILNNCASKGARQEIVQTEGIHDFELFISGYAYMILEDSKRLDTQKDIEVLNQLFCLEAISVLEKSEEKRKTMFEVTGKWMATKEGYFVFENAPFESSPLRFFFDWKEAMEFLDRISVTDEKEKNLLKQFRTLPDDQKSHFQQTLKEKFFYTHFSKQHE